MDKTRLPMTKYILLLDSVLEQMQKDFDAKDVTAIEDLLTYVPIKYLEGYLPEEEGESK